jgi:hypothetical protein
MMHQKTFFQMLYGIRWEKLALFAVLAYFPLMAITEWITYHWQNGSLQINTFCIIVFLLKVLTRPSKTKDVIYDKN